MSVGFFSTIGTLLFWGQSELGVRSLFWRLVGWTTTSSSGSLSNSTIETGLVYGGITIQQGTS